MCVFRPTLCFPSRVVPKPVLWPAYSVSHTSQLSKVPIFFLGNMRLFVAHRHLLSFSYVENYSSSYHFHYVHISICHFVVKVKNVATQVPVCPSEKLHTFSRSFELYLSWGWTLIIESERVIPNQASGIFGWWMGVCMICVRLLQ